MPMTRWVIGLLLLCLVSPVAAASRTDVSAAVTELCATLGPMLINQGSREGTEAVTDDIAGRARPSGGGLDVGAIECDGTGGQPTRGTLPRPEAFRMMIKEP